MKQLHTKEQIDEMRKRLYTRGEELKQTVRHQLTDTKVDVSRDWGGSEKGKPQTTDLRQSIPVIDTPPPSEPEPEKPKRHYRAFILLGSLLIFVAVAVVSSLYVYFGGNQISNANINIAIQGQPLIGGGEVQSLQVAVTNQNTVPIESATLILKYPVGTRSVGDSPRTLFEERIPLNEVTPGEVQNIPVQVAVFGEENDEKIIEATVEYRVGGSNGTFYKDADPFVFRISSSPLVLRIDSVEKVASGQLVDITMTAVSNASTPLNDILITASYPNGFHFESAEPEPVYGQNVWRIDELLPEQSATIVLQGVITGLTEESLRINFEAGPADSNNQFIVGAILTESHTDFTIERPFIDVAVQIENQSGSVAVLDEGEIATVEVTIGNTLDETVYDMAVEVVPGGNALKEDSVRSSSGFYDSNRGSVRWEVANNPTFAEVLPGDDRSLEFTVVPGPNRTTASFDLIVNVYARRVAESSAAETLIGTARTEAKYSASLSLGSQVSLSAGPVPPVVGEHTTYTVTVVAEAGANDLANALVETGLPLYVDWLDAYNADGSVTYNSVSKQLQWVIGDIPSGQQKQLSFDVSIQPSISQLGRTPVIVNAQKLRANDRFTGALLQDQAAAVTTELSTEMGFAEENGKVTR